MSVSIDHPPLTGDDGLPLAAWVGGGWLDCSLLGLGTKEGTRWYRTDPFEKYRENTDDAAVLAMHYNTDLVAQV
jgi:hypothetical protein